MMNGLWTVAFKSDVDLGSGVVVINDERVLGGDSGFTYVGELHKEENGNITGSVKISQFNNTVTPVIPGATSYTLVVSGSANDETMRLTGHVQGMEAMSLAIVGRKVAT